MRYGKAIGLQRTEVLALATAPLPPQLDHQRNVFLFQIMLLRDSDMRALKPHHTQLRELPGHGPILCIELYQQKTGEPVMIPLPPLAATIWQHYEGQLPVFSNWHRNQGIRQVAQKVGLTRECVTVSFSGRTKHELVMPIHEALTTHSARHTGATLLTWASDGDQTLKELALSHVSDSVYGSDTVERYGPRLLEAWRKVLTDERGQNAKDRGHLSEMPPVLPGNSAAPRRILRRGSSKTIS